MEALIHNPCRRCTKRTETCHTTCPDYMIMDEECKLIREQKRKDSICYTRAMQRRLEGKPYHPTREEQERKHNLKWQI